MPDPILSKFKGLDLRRLREVSDPRTARVAVNVDLTLGQEFEARDGLRHLMKLDPQSKGLYAIGGTLRAAITGGQSKPLEAVGPVRVRYDHLGFGDGQFTSVMVRTTNSNIIYLEGALWPSAMNGRTIIINGLPFTVVSTLDDAATLASPISFNPGLYPFVLSGVPALLSRTATIANGTDLVDLSGGIWPPSVDNCTFTINQTGFSARVLARMSDTRIRVDRLVESGSILESPFQLNGTAQDYPFDTMIRVATVESIGANAAFGVYPYLVVERWVDSTNHDLGTVFEHHWITSDATDGDVALTTQVRLPFSPGEALIKMGGKLWAADDVNGVVRFSSTANGPRDWVTPQDAGYIPVITHASGDRRIQGLGVYDDKLAVIFADAVQLWATDPQPSNITLVRVINGPGTDNPRSVVNVLGDLFYFTRGGFRSMHMATVTGQIQQQDDIGGPIDALSQTETREVAVARWSQSRGQYLCAFAGRVYAFKYSPKSKVQGWTLWELGVPVDAMVELNAKTYIRSGDDLYVLDPTYDDGSTWDVVFNDFGGKDPTRRKRFDFVEVAQRGTCDISHYLEPDNDVKYLQGPTLVGTTIAYDRVFIGALSRVLGTRFTGKGRWTLSAMKFQYLELPW